MQDLAKTSLKSGDFIESFESWAFEIFTAPSFLFQLHAEFLHSVWRDRKSVV